MHKIETAAHTAYLDPLVGVGILLRPLPEHDLTLGSRSLHETDWNEMCRMLWALLWEPMENEWGGCLFIGDASDGRRGYGLVGLDPISPDPDMEAWNDAHRELEQAAGLARG